MCGLAIWRQASSLVGRSGGCVHLERSFLSVLFPFVLFRSFFPPPPILARCQDFVVVVPSPQIHFLSDMLGCSCPLDSSYKATAVRPLDDSFPVCSLYLPRNSFKLLHKQNEQCSYVVSSVCLLFRSTFNLPAPKSVPHVLNSPPCCTDFGALDSGCQLGGNMHRVLRRSLFYSFCSFSFLFF